MLASKIYILRMLSVEHEATWFSASDCLLSGGGTLQLHSERIPVIFEIYGNDRNLSLAFQGVLFLLYPLVGHLTDVYLTRYRSLKLSYGILIFTACAAVVYSGIDLAASIIWKIVIFHEMTWYSHRSNNPNLVYHKKALLTFRKKDWIHLRTSTKCSSTDCFHKVPEHRSAFTYWEEDIPRRIDLGKNVLHSWR